MEASTEKVTGFVERNGTSFYYEACGKGEPLLLIHGINLDSRMWREQVPVLSEKYRVISFDLRGMGQTPMTEEPFTLFGDTQAVLQELGIEQAHVIGLSFGGMVALEFAVAHPEMVKSLVLVSSGLHGYPRAERRVKDFAKFVDLYEKGLREETVEMAARMWFDGPDQPVRSEVQKARELFVQMTDHAYSLPPLTKQPAWLAPPPSERLEEIQAPALIIAGGKDYEDFQGIADVLAERIPHAEKVLLADSAHLPPMDQPDQFNRLVLDFIERTRQER
ncbi:alpha/beta hydrolase [Brevibacillus ruminantium]|uniref:Alpha/beta hydrolase n=1 Tax=Brevibacillus ruminantium TaxID=2950604 RepID=A0ABY4WIY1_9BACL|nr:alpha/beta hydrolase [Brevibacillus ruminantium]USG67008.1 alpha/beta hydrolase [Brevibacillus ruminantium]